MRNVKTWLCMIAIVMAIAVIVPQITLGTDPPSASDVTVIGQGGPPGRFAQESSILMTNDSLDYDYRVEVSALAENDENGSSACGGAGCLYEPCECDLVGIFTSPADEVRQAKISCVLPNCRNSGCDPHCDNPQPPAAVTHCTCVSGSYRVTGYRDAGTSRWYPMSSSSWITITNTEQIDDCPDPDPC